MRNHRKIVVIDGLIAHAGSQNLIVDNYHLKKNIARGLHWRELVARFEGPIVRELDAVFLTDWFSESVSSDPGRSCSPISPAIGTPRWYPAVRVSRTTTTSSCSPP